MDLYLVGSNDKKILLQCKHNKNSLNVERFGIWFNTFIHEITLAKKAKKRMEKKLNKIVSGF